MASRVSRHYSLLLPDLVELADADDTVSSDLGADVIAEAHVLHEVAPGQDLLAELVDPVRARAVWSTGARRSGRIHQVPG